jgi:hypothetical protein
VGFHVAADELVDLLLPRSYWHLVNPPRKVLDPNEPVVLFSVFSENMSNINEHRASGQVFLESTDLSPLWSAAASYLRSSTKQFNAQKLRPVAAGQSADRSAHSTEL